jgi:hypothetical protein
VLVEKTELDYTGVRGFPASFSLYASSGAESRVAPTVVADMLHLLENFALSPRFATERTMWLLGPLEISKTSHTACQCSCAHRGKFVT